MFLQKRGIHRSLGNLNDSICQNFISSKCSDIFVYKEQYFTTFQSHRPFVSASNSVDPDETAHRESTHQDIHCLPFRPVFQMKLLFGTRVLDTFKDERVHQQFRGEIVNTFLVQQQSESYPQFFPIISFHK